MVVQVGRLVKSQPPSSVFRRQSVKLVQLFQVLDSCSRDQRRCRKNKTSIKKESCQGLDQRRLATLQSSSDADILGEWLSPKDCPIVCLLNLFPNLESYLEVLPAGGKLFCQELCLPSLWKTYKPSRCVMLPGDARMGKDVETVVATAGAALVYGGRTCSACSSGLPGSCAL